MIRLRSGCMRLFACRLKYVTFAAAFAVPEYAWAVIVVEDRQTVDASNAPLSGLQIAVFINTGGRLALENTRIEARSPDVGVGLITQGDASDGMILSPSVSGPSVRNIMLDNAEINGLNGPAMQASPSSVSDLMITGDTRLNGGQWYVG
ncbi:hypothetical protein KDX38_08335 [Pseudomonas sp. CDFA 602]|uniref:hypothetical protein n=1 Tax=Pseudomonas californiensis TaxID=2829823 RepID=UPI001E508A05|nr:hypothetical protein [Pseudomonas californiensis]MCD5993627.1 hypothetical protein [Pseudomonas californiensis]MCD5999222.1 hypothetical protein [Pseudomonas californiensis]